MPIQNLYYQYQRSNFLIYLSPVFCISSLSYWLTTGLFYCYIIMGNCFCCVITLLALKMSSFLKFILHKVKTRLLFFLHLFIVCFKFVILENLTLNAISLVGLMLTVALVCFYLHFVFFSLGLLHADFTLAASSWIFIFSFFLVLWNLCIFIGIQVKILLCFCLSGCL